MSNPYEPDPHKPQDPQQGGSGGGFSDQPYGQGGQYGGQQYGGQGGGYGGQYGGGQPGGQQFSAPYSNPFGAQPYGQQQPTSTDGVSIAGFVLSLTCCLSFVGAILGFIGLSRTKNDQRKGRWAAVSAIVIGLIGTLVAVGVIVFAVTVGLNTVTPGNAEVGQCADKSFEDDDAIGLRDADCDEPHDVEIVYAGDYSDVEDAVADEGFDIDELSDNEIAGVACTTLVGDEYSEVQTSEYVVGILAENVPPGSADAILCYVERSDGDELDAPLAD
ncbi:DUF4190 domain-containing protein [Nocardioides zeae]|uniref:DUF4190 domain-containing protein n=1 Tax=Nocardioides imazamoxiresistens TaxID=3231893 RepID=A0ABU3PSI1_9ACTN|nr:DUF4190 domain-containing protein [Nocardioides zeae]MDT9591837.1 DUF4190 domain-containing protein [Nocardioides zeae]